MAYSNKALPPGTVLREWRLEQVLGVGGFGIVYKGRGIYFDELVAIKEYFPSAISDRVDGDTVVPTDSDAEEVHALGLKKFVEEAKLLWNLSKPTRHPNIVSVRSLFEIHGTAYMVMDFEDGVSLSDILKSGKRFTEASLMALIRPIAEGLERAHRVGVLHRDIKPPNILVSEDGRPVLIDFGSARFDSGKATNTKVTFHTPPYAAIEQYVKTYEQGPWTDIYALGVVLYECVTGTKPPEVLERMHGGAGQLLAGQPIEGFSEAFLRGIDAAMTIRPGDRPQTIPQWLAMFDPDYQPGLPPVVTGADDMKTRFAAFEELPAKIIPVAPPSLVGAEPVEPDAREAAQAEALADLAVIEPEPQPRPKAEPKPTLAREAPPPPVEAPASRAKLGPARLGAAAAVLAALVGGGVYLLSGRSDADSGSAISSWIPSMISTPAPVVTAVPSAVPTGQTAMQALVEDARKAGASNAAVAAALAGANSLAQLDTELGNLSRQPQAAAQVSAQKDKITGLTRTTATDLATALAREADGRAARLGRTLTRPDQKALLASLQRARGGVDAAAAAARGAVDGPQAMAAARAAVSAFAHFGSVYRRTEVAARAVPKPTATPTALASASEPAAPSTAGIPGKIAELEAVRQSGKSIADQVIAMGRGSKPKSSDSDDIKNAYRVRQDNAQRAKAYAQHLDLLSRTIRGAKSDGAAQNIVSQAKMVRGYLTTLLSRSTTAQANSR